MIQPTKPLTVIILFFVLILIVFSIYSIYLYQKNFLSQLQPINIQVTPSPVTSPTSTALLSFTCPANGWVNCMPVRAPEAQRQCTPEAIKWFETNCPNFQGVAQ